MSLLPSHPILDCSEAADHEQRLLGGDAGREWAAMRQAGAALARGIRGDLTVTGAALAGGRVLVLAGKGHNGGDALLAALELATQQTDLALDVAWVADERQLRPLTSRAWRDVKQAVGDRVRSVSIEQVVGPYTVSIDGVFGFNFQPPLRASARRWLRAANVAEVALRAAVDLPSGWDEEDAFRADVTYATGILKTPLLELATAGRLRYLDLGFFRGDEPGAARVVTPSLLAPLRQLRPARSDKRSLGHLFVIGGSRRYPGAVLMSVQAALRSGVGLLTALVPQSLAPAYAAAWPEVMWVGCAESGDGALSMACAPMMLERMEQADALLIGPGLGREEDPLALAKDLVRQAKVPTVIDADALQADLVWTGSVPRILTPHAGEFQRIASGASLRDFKSTRGSVTVLKGPVTRLSDGSGTIYHSVEGGPVLARGGSGDMLAGLIGGLLAQRMAQARRQADAAVPPPELVYPAILDAAALGVVWHGRAAQLLAEARGEVAVRATELVDFLGPALRSRV